MSQISKNLNKLKTELPPGVDLVAVSKTKPIEDIQEAYAAGHRDFGENKVQEMVSKWEALPKDIRWHMIGHVQGNKIKYMAPFVHLVHGIDKEKRLKELNKEAHKCGRRIDCLLQIHIAQEESKFGFSYTEAEATLGSDCEARFPHLRIRGLMGMATFTDNKEQVRKEFSELAAFFQAEKARRGWPHFDLLSMGMSGDYPLALEEGSNIIRVGSRIFGARS